MISREDVQKLAELSLLAVDEKELDRLTGEIDSILGYVSEIDSFAAGAQTAGDKPLLRNIMRDDIVTNKPREYTDAILDQAPDRDGDYLRVKKIL
jgi:aspartyl-tRNA(Asn)/glutamyl-tRNA(Gln) amidotransferase subunit C